MKKGEKTAPFRSVVAELSMKVVDGYKRRQFIFRLRLSCGHEAERKISSRVAPLRVACHACEDATREMQE